MSSNKSTPSTSKSEKTKSQAQTRKSNTSRHTDSTPKTEINERAQSNKKNKRLQSNQKNRRPQSNQKNSINSATQSGNRATSRVVPVPQRSTGIRYTEPQPLPARENPSRGRRCRRSFSDEVGYDNQRPRRHHRHGHQSERAKEMEAYELGVHPSELQSDSD